MALDPMKYGFSTSKKELHEKYWEITGNSDYLLPDIADEEYQTLLLNFANVQIDAGIDALWLDGLLVQARVFAHLSGDVNHPSVRLAFESASDIVDKIRNYGKKKGRRILVGSWSADRWYESGIPKEYFPPLDFVTVSPSAEEVRDKKLDLDKWRHRVEVMRTIYGDIPIIAFIDWAFTADTPLGVFSQELTPEEQRETLINFSRGFSELGIIFAYPLHGGFMGRDASVLAFGKSAKYDALAPEFDTYKTIEALVE